MTQQRFHSSVCHQKIKLQALPHNHLIPLLFFLPTKRRETVNSFRYLILWMQCYAKNNTREGHQHVREQLGARIFCTCTLAYEKAMHIFYGMNTWRFSGSETSYDGGNSPQQYRYPDESQWKHLHRFLLTIRRSAALRDVSFEEYRLLHISLDMKNVPASHRNYYLRFRNIPFTISLTRAPSALLQRIGPWIQRAKCLTF